MTLTFLNRHSSPGPALPTPSATRKSAFPIPPGMALTRTMSEPLNHPARTVAGFPMTRWSLVDLAAAPDGGEALDRLCRNYWYPLYAFARRSGQRQADAEDLTQGFFEMLLSKNWLADAEREKGRLRTFLLTAFRRYMANEWRREQALRRGGDCERVSLQSLDGEERYASAKEGMVAETLFDRQWALTLMERTLDALRQEYSDTGRGGQFEVLKEALMFEQGAVHYGSLAARLEIGETAVRVAVHRLRKRFREQFRAGVAATLENDGDLESELQYLGNVLAE